MAFRLTSPTSTILSAASLGSAFYVGAGHLAAIQMPAAWTAASLTFQGSLDGTTFYNIYDTDGTEVEIQAAASVQIPVDKMEGAIWMKVRSGTSGTPVTQGADRVLTMLVHKDAPMGR